MPRSDADAVLSSEFLCTAIVDSGVNDPVTRLAVQRMRSDSPRSDRAGLAEALLLGPHIDEAPLWLLKAAAELDLGAPTEPHGYGGRLPLVTLTLSHPSCTRSFRDETLQRCTPHQLAALGGPRCEEQVAHAVAQALRALGGTPPPMTPELLEKPTPAQAVLQHGPLHDLVFKAARDTLPTVPDPGEPSGGDDKQWMERLRQSHDAWDRMWRRILGRHADRHRQFVEWAEGTSAEWTVRNRLLGDLPWTVEPGLLAELAAADLGRFPFEILVAQGCRMRRDGADQQQVLNHFAAELASLDEEHQQRFGYFLERKSTYMLDMGCHAPTNWVRYAASETWRHLLNPAQAKDGYRQVDWRASTPVLTDLAARFAQTAARALPYWEADDRYSAVQPDDVAWVRDMLLHLPAVPDDVKAGVRPIVQHIRKRMSPRHHGAQPRYDHARVIEETLATVERILADPPPAVGMERRRSALGAPETVTVRELGSVQAQLLGEYLDRHAGNDVLVEKALLATAAGDYRASQDFDDVLRRHSSPDSVLLRLTVDLRGHLGGGPAWRKAWTRLVLARSDTGLNLVRALPAWSALRACGERHGSSHPLVVSVVCDALGTDQDAWDRFAASPATHSGASAWLRLGDLLDSAVAGAPWPKPPGRF